MFGNTHNGVNNRVILILHNTRNNLQGWMVGKSMKKLIYMMF